TIFLPVPAPAFAGDPASLANGCRGFAGDKNWSAREAFRLVNGKLRDVRETLKSVCKALKSISKLLKSVHNKSGAILFK
ncbi:MAG: hypothetical protein L7F78_19715, partial [Syntrophales bacterium LBB04]|nr:hypothetical protein [Syntrophales bacterium LBB04]